MFSFRDHREADVRVDVAFTDASIDLQGLRPGFAAELPRLEEACGVRFARVNQVHGAEVLMASQPGPPLLEDVPTADALVTTTPGLGLMVRVADCVPVLLADPEAGVVAAVHAGRPGLVAGVVPRALETMRSAGARRIRAWVGPHVCGACYEVPEQLRADVCAVVPEAYAETSWGTPSVDVGAGVRAQLVHGAAQVVDASRCTIEDEDLFSYRRQGRASGRLAGLVWVRP